MWRVKTFDLRVSESGISNFILWKRKPSFCIWLKKVNFESVPTYVSEGFLEVDTNEKALWSFPFQKFKMSL
jgi:hypothetical protein